MLHDKFKIYKHSFSHPYHQMGSAVKVTLPPGAVVIDFALQHGVPVMWYRFDLPVDPRLEAHQLERLYLLCMTGPEYSRTTSDGRRLEIKRHVGTAMNAQQDFVLHLFEMVVDEEFEETRRERLRERSE